MLNVDSIFAYSMYEPAKTMAKHILAHKRILLSCHMNPDADAIGSMFALAYGLKQLGKGVAMCNASDVPDSMTWLPAPSRVHKNLRGIGFKPDLAVVLDCGDKHRLGKIQDEVLAISSISIDHHIDNPNFGSLDNWVDTRMSATGQMVAAILHELNISLDGHIGDALYAAISADTGGFRYDNTSEHALLLASYLVGQGLDVARVRSQMDNNWSIGRIHLWGALMEDARIERSGTIALITAPLKQLAKHKASAEDLEGLVENLRRLRGVLAVAMIREDGPKLCKASLRSTGKINVQAMVSPLGGGGHRNAAGALLTHDLDTSSEMILKSMHEWLDAHENL